MEKVRVSKLMSAQGLCSRREADSYIERGWVLVDGVPVTGLGTRIYPTQTITLAKAAQTRQNDSVTILLNKPIGFVSGAGRARLPAGDYSDHRQNRSSRPTVRR